MSSPSPIQNAIQSLRDANDHSVQLDRLSAYLRPLLLNPVPRLDKSPSVAFIASKLWFGEKDSSLSNTVADKCFHAETQSRRIIGVVQAYGCGKTKTGLRLAENFILLPIRFNVDSMGSVTLVDDVQKEQKRLLKEMPIAPNYKDVETYSKQCERLVNLGLLVLVALYDHCIEKKYLASNPADRFLFALLLLSDQHDVVQWCKTYFHDHKAIILNDNDYNKFVNSLVYVRPVQIVFLLDEVHVLYDKCRGYCLHRGTISTNAAKAVDEWRREQNDGIASAGHQTCTDLFYQFRLVMFDYLLRSGSTVGFVMCSTMFRIWKVLEEENSPLSRGTIEQFFRLHWFSHSDIKAAVRFIFDVKEEQLDALELAVDGSFVHPHMRLSAYGRPLFLMEFLEQLCNSFEGLADRTDATLNNWLRSALNESGGRIMQRAENQIEALVIKNAAVDIWTARQIVHLLYTTQRLCGGSLALSSSDNDTLGNIIAKGVARLDVVASRFRISDAMFAEALAQKYSSPELRNDAVLKTLNQNANLSNALVSNDSSQKGFLAERLLAWLAISNQLNVTVLDQTEAVIDKWVISCTADSAGTLPELDYGESSAAEPPVLSAIMSGSLNRLLLPTTLAGPDLWLRALVNGTECVVAVQSKVVSAVYTFDKFTEALASLNPTSMYRSPIATAARALWLPMLVQLETMSYHRIIFCACGFSAEVQFRVREYNYHRGCCAVQGQPRRFIHLLHVDDIRPSIGLLYETLMKGVTTAVHGTEDHSKFYLAHEWLNLTQSERKQKKLAMLKEQCKYRGIKTDKKRMVTLLDELNNHSNIACVTERLQLLDPNFR